MAFIWNVAEKQPKGNLWSTGLVMIRFLLNDDSFDPEGNANQVPNWLLPIARWTTDQPLAPL
jgi:hypothetical protein